MRSFENKVAAITGAGSGIGRALAVELGRQKCNVALSDVNEEGLLETVGLLRGLGVEVTSEPVDVANREAVHAWADQVVDEHGKVNLIFNNAGVALASTVDGMSYGDFEWLMGVNFWGVVYGTKAFLPYLKASADGHIINLSSVFGLAGIPSQSAYNSAKFAVRGFTESLRQELDMMSCGVSASSVHPGGIKTGIARSSRIDPSVRDLGISDTDSRERFEKTFITGADTAARAILDGVRRNQRRILVGPDARVFDWVVRLLPSAYQRITIGYSKFSAK
ncbi:MAG: SDR family NAD(P)-dependent oxidoreductase [Deltaproteobacteria bacterium]|nr:SDR family NAD(P)-dependent oxidoreductase [Deltaproteobacteria bacterium]NND30285.1 SDR family NAD(P)-dependent oxidoreductase [Myxococcales bacterium]MBT8464026.1 SDR family NAD(P)-dependent oxidoreductase [Deltaproteobacteria bacterium]MBT8481555.1 SDR family NAD(P)-dependent oxidoreductase [Deltaproteobacteria bacterium]NNK07876.1 SDR family NAD(P)-dependent oxidoreductase [Myxococcales bacterium]